MIEQETHTLGRFRIEGQFRSEGPGKLYRGTTDAGRPVLLSVVPASLAHGAAVAADSGLRLVDLGTLDSGEIYLAYDIPSGETLAQRLDNGPLGWQLAARAFSTAVGTLRASHQRGEAYAEITPAKMVLRTDQTLALIGRELRELNRAFDRRKDEEQPPTMDTAPYLSPGRARGERATPASDIFAMGSVIFEAIAARRAFDATNLLQVLHQVQSAEVPELRSYDPAIPQVLSDVVAAALSKDPARRPGVEELLRTLEFVGSSLSPSRKVTPAPRPAEPVADADLEVTVRKRAPTDDVKTEEYSLSSDLAAAMRAEAEPSAPLENGQAAAEVRVKSDRLSSGRVKSDPSLRAPAPGPEEPAPAPAASSGLPARCGVVAAEERVPSLPEINPPAPAISLTPSMEMPAAEEPAPAAPEVASVPAADQGAHADMVIRPAETRQPDGTGFTDEWFHKSAAEPPVAGPAVVPQKKGIARDTRIIFGAVAGDVVLGVVLFTLAFTLGSSNKRSAPRLDRPSRSSTLRVPTGESKESLEALLRRAQAARKLAEERAKAERGGTLDLTAPDREPALAKTEPAPRADPKPATATPETKPSSPVVVSAAPKAEAKPARKPEPAPAARKSAPVAPKRVVREPARRPEPLRPAAKAEPAPAKAKSEIRDPFGGGTTKSDSLKDPF